MHSYERSCNEVTLEGYMHIRMYAQPSVSARSMKISTFPLNYSYFDTHSTEYILLSIKDFQ